MPCMLFVQLWRVRERSRSLEQRYLMKSYVGSYRPRWLSSLSSAFTSRPTRCFAK